MKQTSQQESAMAGQAVHCCLARDEGVAGLRELAELVQRCPASAEGAA